MLIPNALLALLIVALVVAASVLGLMLIQRRVPGYFLEDNTQAVTGSISTIGLLYAVIIGSVVASGWTRFNAAQSSLNHDVRVGAVPHALAAIPLRRRSGHPAHRHGSRAWR